MPTITLTIPGPVATELNNVAKEQGYANGKGLVIAYLKAVLRDSRQAKAAAQAQVDLDAEAIV